MNNKIGDYFQFPKNNNLIIFYFRRTPLVSELMTIFSSYKVAGAGFLKKGFILDFLKKFYREFSVFFGIKIICYEDLRFAFSGFTNKTKFFHRNSLKMSRDESALNSV